MAAGIITRHVHSTAKIIFNAITRRANTKKDAIPAPKFPVSQNKTKIHKLDKVTFNFLDLCS